MSVVIIIVDLDGMSMSWGVAGVTELAAAATFRGKTREKQRNKTRENPPKTTFHLGESPE